MIAASIREEYFPSRYCSSILSHTSVFMFSTTTYLVCRSYFFDHVTSVSYYIFHFFYTLSRDVCRALGITPSVLGKIVGVVPVEPGRLDLGLNLKRNGQYQLSGYIRAVFSTNNNYNNNNNEKGVPPSGRGVVSVWGQGDSVRVRNS